MNVAILASGNGSNFQRIAEYFSEKEDVNIKLMLCNKKNAYVFERAKNLNIKSELISNESLKNPDGVLKMLKDNDIDFIVLAGFLLLIPEILVNEYDGKIVNIHPALLPDFGGKGMYGMNVHEAVVNSRASESGITIHYVNNKYDSGQIIAQYKCPVTTNDTPETLAQKIHQLEYEYFPKTLEKLFI